MDILSRGFAPHQRDDRGDLLSGEVSAHSGFGALPDLDLDGRRVLQDLVGETVLVGDVLVDVSVGGDHLVVECSALSAAHGGLGHSAAFGECDLGVPRQCSEAHVGNENGGFEDHGFLRILADNGAYAYLLIVRQREMCQLRS